MPGEEESDSEGQPGATWEHQSLAQVQCTSRCIDALPEVTES